VICPAASLPAPGVVPSTGPPTTSTPKETNETLTIHTPSHGKNSDRTRAVQNDRPVGASVACYLASLFWSCGDHRRYIHQCLHRSLSAILGHDWGHSVKIPGKYGDCFQIQSRVQPPHPMTGRLKSEQEDSPLPGPSPPKIMGRLLQTIWDYMPTRRRASNPLSDRRAELYPFRPSWVASSGKSSRISWRCASPIPFSE